MTTYKQSAFKALIQQVNKGNDQAALLDLVNYIDLHMKECPNVRKDISKKIVMHLDNAHLSELKYFLINRDAIEATTANTFLRENSSITDIMRDEILYPKDSLAEINVADNSEALDPKVFTERLENIIRFGVTNFRNTVNLLEDNSTLDNQNNNSVHELAIKKGSETAGRLIAYLAKENDKLPKQIKLNLFLIDKAMQRKPELSNERLSKLNAYFMLRIIGALPIKIIKDYAAREEVNQPNSPTRIFLKEVSNFASKVFSQSPNPQYTEFKNNHAESAESVINNAIETIEQKLDYTERENIIREYQEETQKLFNATGLNENNRNDFFTYTMQYELLFLKGSIKQEEVEQRINLLHYFYLISNEQPEVGDEFRNLETQIYATIPDSLVVKPKFGQTRELLEKFAMAEKNYTLCAKTFFHLIKHEENPADKNNNNALHSCIQRISSKSAFGKIVGFGLLLTVLAVGVAVLPFAIASIGALATIIGFSASGASAIGSGVIAGGVKYKHDKKMDAQLASKIKFLGRDNSHRGGTVVPVSDVSAAAAFEKHRGAVRLQS